MSDFYCNGQLVELGSGGEISGEYVVSPETLEQRIPLFYMDGIGCQNYFDAAYNIANSTTYSGTYKITPKNYLPAGTYTISSCSQVEVFALDGTKTTISSGSHNSPATFTLTENAPFYQAMIHQNYFMSVTITRTDTPTFKYGKYTLENFDTKAIEFYPTHWSGKTYVAIGDSITRGYAPGNTDLGITDGSQIENCYAVYAGKKLNLETHNWGTDGATVRTTLTSNKVTRMQSEGVIPDVVTIMLGANDVTSNEISLGAITDEFDTIGNCTFYSGLKEIVRQIQEYAPACTIILIAPPVTSSRNNTYDDYRLAAKNIAELYNVLFMSFDEGTGFNLNSQTSVSYFQLDSIHPNFRAHEIMGKRLTGFIASH